MTAQDSSGRPVVLVVDDEPDVAAALADTLRAEFEVQVLHAPEAALAALERRQVAVLLADQRMPGLGGVELLARARRASPDVVGVLITAYADFQSAVRAINEARAFALVAKPWEIDELLVVVRQAVDAHRALRRRRTDLEAQRELHELEALSRASPVPLTAQRFGAAAVRERLPQIFDELARGYAEALEHAFEQRIYRVDHPLSDELRGLADRLGGLRAGPRDVLDLHTAVVKQRLASASVEEGAGYAEESRLLVLELMGHLVSYYRGYALGVSA